MSLVNSEATDPGTVRGSIRNSANTGVRRRANASGRGRLARFVARRLALIPVTLFVVLTLSFMLVQLMPGDPALYILGPFATDAEIARIRADLDLDQPVLVQYARYAGRVLRGDLGESFFTNRSIAGEIAAQLPNTVELVVFSLSIAAVLGLALGAIAGYFQRRWPDSIVRMVITAFQSVPPFLLGLLSIFLFYFVWKIAPAPVGRQPLTIGSGGSSSGFLLTKAVVQFEFGRAWTLLTHMLLPGTTLGVIYSAYLGKTARSTIGAAMRSGQIEYARAVGLSEWRVLRYAMLQARTPVLTYGLTLFGALIGGAAIVEVVFAWNGIGSWAITAMHDVDVPAIQGFILVSATITMLLYVLLDILVMALDPRIRI